MSDLIEKVVVIDITDDKLHKVMTVVKQWQNAVGTIYLHVKQGYPDVEPRTAKGSLD